MDRVYIVSGIQLMSGTEAPIETPDPKGYRHCYLRVTVDDNGQLVSPVQPFSEGVIEGIPHSESD